MLIALSGPSGIGKGFIKEKLLTEYPNIEEIQWITTRKLRATEIRGNRVSVSRNEFRRLVRSQELVLVQTLYGNEYGMRKSELLSSTRLLLTELHPNNLQSAIFINPSIITIGFSTNDVGLLDERLSVRRGTETATEVAERIAAAKSEIVALNSLSHLCRKIIEVTRENEGSIFEQVHHILNPIILKGD